MTRTRALEGEIIASDATTLARVERGPYQAAMATCLQGRTENTRTSSLAGLRTFLDATAKRPGEIEPLDVARWKEHLNRRGLEEATGAQRLSILSRHYT